MISKHPIGVFDSGLGGLTILKEITNVLPIYDYIYLGDSARTPYGPKSFETVYEYTLQAVRWLFDQGCPLVILACNTASAKALRTIQQKDLPRIAPDRRVLGVIRPTTEVIGDYTETGHIGILGTQGTVDSGSYKIEIGKFFPEVKLYQEACPDWVPLVESGRYLQPDAAPIIKNCLDKLVEQSIYIDTILLACTHYPLLKDLIESQLLAPIQVVSQGEIIASSLKYYLERHPEMASRISQGENKGYIAFHTTGDSEEFGTKASIFWGEAIQSTTIMLV